MREMEMTKRHSSARTVVLFAYISVLIIGLFACDDRKDSSSAHSGKLRLSLTADTTSLKKGVNSNLTKAVSDEFEKFLTVEDYQIRIVTDKDTVKSYDRFDKMPSEIELPEGAYTIVASKGNDLPAAFENPYFEGSTAFTIKEGMSTPLDMTCTLGNARITAEYTDDFKEAYSDYTALLSSTFATTEFEIAKGETRPAYMQVAKEGTDMAIGIRLKKINTEEEKTYYVPTALKLERRQNVRLIFKTDGEALEGIGLTIMLDDSLEEKNFTTEIPDFMWKPFDKPTLVPDGFEDGEEMTIKTSVFDDDLQVGFVMPGGVNSLIVKHWKGDAEDDAEIIDLVSEPEKAKEKYLSWIVGENEYAPLKGTKAGYLILKNAIKSLKAQEDEPVEYHYSFYGKDNTGKEYPTNEVNLTVIVEPADAPFIENFVLPAEIVEGDELESMIETILAADGVINEEKTTLTIEADGMEPLSYHLMKMEDRISLYEKHGIGIEIIASTKLQMVFLKPFTVLLSAPDKGGNRSYTYKLHLEDSNGKVTENTKTVLVKAPEFELATTEGDAFAKRIVLRVDFAGKENKNKLTYQYLQNMEWVDIPSPKLKPEGNVQWVDTLRGLEANTEYSVRAVYNKGQSYERISKVCTLTTEQVGSIPNGSFEEWSIAPDKNGSTAEAAKNTITGVGKSEYPYRYWELWQPWSSTENAGWNTLNPITTQYGSMNDGWVTAGGDYTWTRYATNSGTIKAEGTVGKYAALVRTIGWGSGNTAAGSASIIHNITPGELYLGNCVDKKTEYGMAFASRPTGFSFLYKYNVKSGSSDKFVAQIRVYASDNSLIAEAELPQEQSGVKSDWGAAEVRLNYSVNAGRKKATKMCIYFKSSSSDNYDYLRDNLITMPSLGNLSNAESVGSQLYIDNVNLIYE